MLLLLGGRASVLAAQEQQHLPVHLQEAVWWYAAPRCDEQDDSSSDVGSTAECCPEKAQEAILHLDGTAIRFLIFPGAKQGMHRMTSFTDLECPL